MAKDPAFLFYTSDFLTGTMFMTDAQVGQYIRLLCAQHQHGHLSEEQFRVVCPGMDELILSKFKRDEKGRFFNEKAEKEMNRRKSFTESRRGNLSKKKGKNAHMERHMSTHMEPHMDAHMETETITDTNTVFKGGTGENWNQFPKPENLPEIPQLKIDMAVQLLYHTKRLNVPAENIRGLYAVFRQQNLTGKKFYQAPDDVYSHFLNWIKTQNFEHGTTHKNGNGKNAGLSALLSELQAGYVAGGAGSPGG